MEEELHTCNIQFLSISVIVVLSILSLIIGRKALKGVPGLMRALKIFTRRPHPVMVHLHREVGELRRATLQIAKDWNEMTILMTTVRDQQCSFVCRLDNDFQFLGDYLQKSLQASLAEECLRNDQRFVKINKLVDDFREDLRQLKDVIQTQNELLQKDRDSVVTMVDGWTQTEAAARKRQKEGHGKITESIGTEHESSKSIIMIIKKALLEFLKEAQRNLSQERDEMMENIRDVFSQLAEDRDDIKKAIANAFSATAKQSQKNFEQFGYVGRDAMNCLAVLNEKSEKAASTRFHEFAEKLKDFSKPLRVIDINVSSIKDTLDNIDNQFDEIYKKLELGCQSNSEQCEEIAEKLKATTDEWNAKYSGLEDTSRQLSAVVDKIKDMLSHFQGSAASPTTCPGMVVQSYSEKSLKTSSDLSVVDDSYLMNQTFDSYPRSDGLDNLPTLLRICNKKLHSLNLLIEQGTNGINRSIENLLLNLRFLTDTVNSSVNRLRNLNEKLPDGGQNNMTHQGNMNRELQEFVGDIVSLNSNADSDEFPILKARKRISSKSAQWLSQIDESNAGRYPQAMGIIEANLKTMMKTKCLRDVGKNLESCASPVSSDTSVATLNESSKTLED